MVRRQKSTYAGIKVLYENEDGHIKTHSLDPAWASKEWLAEFQNLVDETKLTNEQRAKICETKTIQHVNKFVKVEITNATMLDAEEKAKKDAEQEEIKAKINKYANHVYNKCLVKNGIA